MPIVKENEDQVDSLRKRIVIDKEAFIRIFFM